MTPERVFGAVGLREFFAERGRVPHPHRPCALRLGKPTFTDSAREQAAALETSTDRPPNVARIERQLQQLGADLEAYGCSAVFYGGRWPHLELAPDASIHWDDAADFFALRYRSTVLATSDPDALINHALVYVLHQGCAGDPRPAHVASAALSLVGQRAEEVERLHILQTLKHFHGNRTHAARALDISVRTLRNKLRLYSDQLTASR